MKTLKLIHNTSLFFFGQVKDMETHLLRLQSDLQKCVSLIQDPRKLKSSLQTIYARYGSQAEQVGPSVLTCGG